MQVLVIGAGVFGAWTALWLRRRGASVMLVEQYGPGNALSSSGDETRVTRSAHGPDELYPRWQRRALEQWLALDASLFLQTGVTWFVGDEDGFERASLAVLDRLGIAAERIEVDDATRRWPQVDFDGIRWVLWEPEAGALLARRGVAAVAARFVDEGGELRVGRASFDQDGVIVQVEGESVGFDEVVLAVGSWLPTFVAGSSELRPAMIRRLALRVSRQEVVYFATPPGDARFDAAEQPIWVERGASIYGLPSVEHRGFKVAPDWPGPEVDPDTQDRRLTDASVEAARTYVRRRFPALADQPVAEGRVCQYELTPDTHFLVDRLGDGAAPQPWVVGGGSGHGFKHGPVVGEYLSGLILGMDVGELAPPDDRFALRDRSPSTGVRTAGQPPEAG